MPITQCRICRKEFYIKPIHQKKGWGKYCSRECTRQSQFKGQLMLCAICKKEVYRTPKEINKSKSGLFFCSKSCQTIWRNKILYTGKNHSNWKTGIRAYRRILKEANLEQKCQLCGIKDSRILLVHHLDQNRKNNSVSNLKWLCYNCHYLVHHFYKEKNKLD